VNPVHVALPNLLSRDDDVHATMTHAILRHDGVGLGKMDCIGSMPTQG